jgi:hypothetical protein
MVLDTVDQAVLEKSLLTVCTMAKYEVAYIVEWVEFMRIQGVQQFVVYDDNITLFFVKNFTSKKTHSVSFIFSRHLGQNNKPLLLV